MAVAASVKQDLLRYRMFVGVAFAMAVVLGLVGACESGSPDDSEAGDRSIPRTGGFATAGQDVLRVDEPEACAGSGAAAIGVNSDLWQASLDTISFMPLASADHWAGVIITDWYQPPETLRERVKVSLYVLTCEPRPNGVRVAVFRQHRDSFGDWTGTALDHQMARGLEEAILARVWKLWFRQRRDPVDPYGPVARVD